MTLGFIHAHKQLFYKHTRTNMGFTTHTHTHMRDEEYIFLFNTAIGVDSFFPTPFISLAFHRASFLIKGFGFGGGCSCLDS